MKLTPVLQALRLPGRLTAEEAAELLGYPPHALPVLTKAGLVKPVGQPAKNSPRHFSSAEILTLAQDRNFLHRAEIVLSRHWRQRKLKRNIEVTAA